MNLARRNEFGIDSRIDISFPFINIISILIVIYRSITIQMAAQKISEKFIWNFNFTDDMSFIRHQANIHKPIIKSNIAKLYPVAWFCGIAIIIRLADFI